MLVLRIPDIKIISQNQKMQGRAIFRAGTRQDAHKRINNIMSAAIRSGRGYMDGVEIQQLFSFLNRRMLATFFKSKKYKQFENDLTVEILKAMAGQGRPIYSKNIQVLISISTYLDIDNPVKGIIDVLCKTGIIENDREIIKLKVVKVKRKRGSRESLIIKIDGDKHEN